MNNIDYKYNELECLEELKKYIDSTYEQHYAQNKIQTTEFIIDSGHGVGFCMGNIQKYAQRYGKKEGYNRKDIMKILHYAIILLYVHDKEHSND
jgi:conjugal transfer/entry exclusion protein